eukprot:gene4689-20977_t
MGQNMFNRGNNCRKRQRITDENDHDSFAIASINENKRRFLHFVRDSGVYQTDVFKQSKEGDTIYLPLTGDLFVNLDRADEISFTEGLFFTGDENGRYCNSVRGTAMHIWRYSDNKEQMVITKSFLITEQLVRMKQ